MLTDASSLTAVVERLILKKQAIKQGMMQQLLYRKSRLPSFSSGWVTTTAGEIGTFKGGSGFPVRFQGSKVGDLPFFKVSDMNDPGNEVFMRSARNYIGEAQRALMGAIRMPRDAIVFAKVGAAVFLERKRILAQPSCIDNNMAAMVVDPRRADARFMHYWLSGFPMSSLVATGALPSINGGQLRSIQVELPSELREQRAIAAVLADVDQELVSLEGKLKKVREIKQGMMQELLTGRTQIMPQGASA
jgi:type I restriction enzyme S subunit